MEVFASGGRTPAVRVLVCILCALFIFAVVAAPPAQAVALESVALFGLAAVLSAATAALGYKLSNNAQGKASLQSMCTAFANDAVMGAKVLVGMKIYGLQEGMKYIKMQVRNGKTYLDSKIVAWCQKYLSSQGVYNEDTIESNVPTGSVSLSSASFGSFSDAVSSMRGLSFPDSAALPFSVSHFFELYNLGVSSLPNDPSYYDAIFLNAFYDGSNFFYSIQFRKLSSTSGSIRVMSDSLYSFSPSPLEFRGSPLSASYAGLIGIYSASGFRPFGSSYSNTSNVGGSMQEVLNAVSYVGTDYYTKSKYGVCGSNYGLVGVSGNTTGLSGSDTLGKDYINVTLEQILAGLKDWAKDWYDAGVESVLDGAAAGDIDLPLTVGAGAATLNPDVAADEDLVYYPPFDIPLEDVRSGSTAATDVTAGQEQAKTEANTADLSENQSIVNDFLNWALDYISIDKGLFAKFPLCIPYDAYLLACAAGGRDAVGGSSVFGASPGDLSGAMTSAQVSEQSDFTPVVHIKNDLQLSDQKVPIDIEIDLTPFSDMVAFGRAGISIVFIAGLIAAEYARIKGGKS